MFIKSLRSSLLATPIEAARMTCIQKNSAWELSPQRNFGVHANHVVMSVPRLNVACQVAVADVNAIGNVPFSQPRCQRKENGVHGPARLKVQP